MSTRNHAMSHGNSRPARQLEDVISLILQWGVTISTVVTLTGLLMLLFTGQTGQGPLVFAGRLSPDLGPGPSGPTEVIAHLLPPEPGAVMGLGLLLLILTPIVRVAASLGVFLRDRDRAYILITTLVLVVLAVSFFLGAGTA